MQKLAMAWLLMWGFSYIVVGIVAPWISDEPPLAYQILGGIMIFLVCITPLAYDKLGNLMLGIIWFSFGIMMVYGGVASWTGLTPWNVLYDFHPLVPISMAFADLIAGFVMFLLAIEEFSANP